MGDNPGTRKREQRAKTHSNKRVKTQGELAHEGLARRAAKRAAWEKKNADMSKLDEFGRPTHTKDGHVILRFR